MQSSRSRAWLTPDTEDALAELVCRRIFIPDSPAFRQSVGGALLELTHSWNWEQYGTMTPDQAALAMLEIYNEYMLNGACDTGGNAPFWSDEEGDDTDDTEPPQPTFAWYEDLADWAVTAFLAVSFTPAAAMQFVTTARQIRFYFRKRDYGAIFNVLWDDELIGEVDTYSATPDVGYFDYFAPSASEHTLRIEHSGEHNPDATPAAAGYAIEIVRGRLRLAGASTRYNPITDEVEYSPDDGATWTPSPENDPRDDVTLPPRGGTAVQCDSAANAASFVRQLVEALINAVSQGSAAFAIAGALVALLAIIAGLWWLFIPLLVTIASAAINIGSAGLSAAFTQATWDTFQCILYCRMNSVGALSPTTFENVKDDVNDLIGGDAAAVLNPLLDVLGWGGLTTVGRIGGIVGDCDECGSCGWCYTFDFALSTGDWQLYSPSGGGITGNWIASLGWQHGDFRGYSAQDGFDGYRGARIQFSVPAGATITKIEMEFDLTKGTYSGAGDIAYLIKHGATNLVAVANGSATNGTNKLATWQGSRDSEGVCLLIVDTCHDPTEPFVYNGYSLIRRVTFEGTGDNPFGESNC